MKRPVFRIVAVLPELLGTYGDGGNLLVLQRRLEWRDIPHEIVRVGLGQQLPENAGLYVLGGGEDEAQLSALDYLRGSGLQRAVEGGAHVLGVCAGLQLLGTSFVGADGSTHEGLGLVDLLTERLEVRAVGEARVVPDTDLDLPLLSGFENHRGRTQLGVGVRPLGRVVTGVGNGSPGLAEGAITDRLLLTYLHGPVLARNPALADLVLSRALGRRLSALDVAEHEPLRVSLLGSHTATS